MNPRRTPLEQKLGGRGRKSDLDAWVPALMLYRCRRTQKGYEAVPTWRPSTRGRELGKRHRNLKIVMSGIRDFGCAFCDGLVLLPLVRPRLRLRAACSTRC